MTRPAILLALCSTLSGCGTAAPNESEVLDRTGITEGVLKRSPVLAVTVPKDARTEGFDDDPRLLTDEPSFIVRGERYRVSIDLSHRPPSSDAGRKAMLAGREALVTKSQLEDGGTTGKITFPSAFSSSGAVGPAVDWRCQGKSACATAERIVSSLQVSWAKLEGSAPPPAAPPQSTQASDRPPPKPRSPTD